jgi:hypothetical protein
VRDFIQGLISIHVVEHFALSSQLCDGSRPALIDSTRFSSLATTIIELVTTAGHVLSKMAAAAPTVVLISHHACWQPHPYAIISS